MTVRDLVGLDQSKQETTIDGGRDEGDAGQMGQGSSPCVPLSLFLCLVFSFWFKSFSHYVRPDDNQSVSVSH